MPSWLLALTGTEWLTGFPESHLAASRCWFGCVAKFLLLLLQEDSTHRRHHHRRQYKVDQLIYGWENLLFYDVTKTLRWLWMQMLSTCAMDGWCVGWFVVSMCACGGSRWVSMIERLLLPTFTFWFGFSVGRLENFGLLIVHYKTNCWGFLL